VTHADQIRERVAQALAPLTGTVRATVWGEVGPHIDLRIDELSDLAPHLDGLVLRRGPIEVTYDLSGLAEERTVRGQFVRDVRDAADLTDDQRRRVLFTGLRAFDGRRDLEVQGC
jgi:hypothetical protein